MKKINCAVITLLLIFSAAAKANLTSEEKKIQAEVKATQDAALVTLEKWVNINSGTANVAGVKKFGALVQKDFEKLGFKTHWANLPSNMHKAPTLIAERKGKSAKHILLIGHLDTVFPKESKFQHFEKKKLTAKGPGVLDDKGGVVVILYALRALDKLHLLNNANITVVLTGDEEESGKPTSISRKPLIDAAKGADIALDFEPALTEDSVSIGRRGITNWQVTSHGHEAHSSTIFAKDVGDGAIYELARILNEFHTQFTHEKYLTVNPGRIAGGNLVTDDMLTAKANVLGRENVVAKIAIANGDVRYLTVKQKQAFKARAENIIAAHLNGAHSSITFQDGIPAMAPTENNRKMLEAYSRVSEDLGFGKVKELPGGLRGAGDISYVAEFVPYNLVGLGPIGYGMHSEGETLEMATLNRQTQRAALLIYRLL